MLSSCAHIIFILVIVFMPTCIIEGVMHPTSTMHESMTCDEFTKTSRFNPYSVVGHIWMTFYYWAPQTPHMEHIFAYPTPQERTFLKNLLDDKYVTIPVNWTARVVVMRNIITGERSLLVEKGDRGQFWLYGYIRGKKKGEKVAPTDVRLKQTGDNKYVGFMLCKKEIVYVMTRFSNIPPKAKIQDAAACIGYRSRGGKSYLYQGHNWGPVGEMEEDEYWNPQKYEKQLEEDLKKADAYLAWKASNKKRKLKKSKDDHDHHVDRDILA